MSVVRTGISLVTRVVLAYILSGFGSIGVIGIWMAIPIGWVQADLVGLIYYKMKILLEPDREIQNNNQECIQ